jgi:hypothetical protein
MSKDDKKKDTQDDEKGFTVHDKRRIEREGAEEPEPARPEAEPDTAATAGGATEAPPPDESGDHSHPAGEHEYVPLSFTSFIMSLSTSALIYLGQVPDPISGEKNTDLLGARQTIDLISLIKEKTKGNLTPDEEGFIEAVLYDLRMLFVRANK